MPSFFSDSDNQAIFLRDLTDHVRPEFIKQAALQLVMERMQAFDRPVEIRPPILPIRNAVTPQPVAQSISTMTLVQQMLSELSESQWLLVATMITNISSLMYGLVQLARQQASTPYLMYGCWLVNVSRNLALFMLGCYRHFIELSPYFSAMSLSVFLMGLLLVIDKGIVLFSDLSVVNWTLISLAVITCEDMLKTGVVLSPIYAELVDQRLEDSSEIFSDIESPTAEENLQSGSLLSETQITDQIAEVMRSKWVTHLPHEAQLVNHIVALFKEIMQTLSSQNRLTTEGIKTWVREQVSSLDGDGNLTHYATLPQLVEKILINADQRDREAMQRAIHHLLTTVKIDERGEQTLADGLHYQLLAEAGLFSVQLFDRVGAPGRHCSSLEVAFSQSGDPDETVGFYGRDQRSEIDFPLSKKLLGFLDKGRIEVSQEDDSGLKINCRVM